MDHLVFYDVKLTLYLYECKCFRYFRKYFFTAAH